MRQKKDINQRKSATVSHSSKELANHLTGDTRIAEPFPKLL